VIGPATIAVIDDDESVRTALRRLLRSFGLLVETFATAEEFLHQSSQLAADCLILDVHLPGLNGLELQQFLRAAGQHVPIVFITAYGDGQERELALRGGATAFLTKPFEEDILRKALECAVGAG
jgi:FixJ family two-component response regulator